MHRGHQAIGQHREDEVVPSNTVVRAQCKAQRGLLYVGQARPAQLHVEERQSLGRSASSEQGHAAVVHAQLAPAPSVAHAVHAVAVMVQLPGSAAQASSVGHGQPTRPHALAWAASSEQLAVRGEKEHGMPARQLQHLI